MDGGAAPDAGTAEMTLPLAAAPGAMAGGGDDSNVMMGATATTAFPAGLLGLENLTEIAALRPPRFLAPMVMSGAQSSSLLLATCAKRRVNAACLQRRTPKTRSLVF